MDEALEPFERDPSGNPYALHESLQELMQGKVGITRTEDGMQEALDEIASLAERRRAVGLEGSPAYHPGWHTWLDLGSLLLTAEAVARCALERRESRGAHTRIDHPGKDPEQERYNFVVSRGEEGMEIRREPVPQPPEELATLIEEGS